MGFFFSQIKKLLSTEHMKEIAIIELDNAGKTTILYRMKQDSTVETIPTIGFNVETFDVHGTKFNVWDIGGQDEIRPLWENYIELASGVVYVVDIVDQERWEKSGIELRKIHDAGFLEGKPLLILANKADNPKDPRMDNLVNDLVMKLGVREMGVNYGIFHVAAKDTPDNKTPLDRLVPAFEWMVDQLASMHGK